MYSKGIGEKLKNERGMHVFDAYESRKMKPFLYFNISAWLS